MNWLLVILVVSTPIAHAPEEDWASGALFKGQTSYDGYVPCMDALKMVRASFRIGTRDRRLTFCVPAFRKSPYTRKDLP